MRLAIGLGVLLIALSSCNQENDIISQQKMDSLNAILENAQLKLDSVDLKEIDWRIDSVVTDRDYLEMTFKDTLEREDAIAVGKYFGLVRSLENLKENRNRVADELTYTRQQVRNLKNDLKSELVPDSMKTIYIDSETKAVGTIAESCGNLKTWYDICVIQYADDRLKVLEIMERMSGEVTDSQ